MKVVILIFILNFLVFANEKNLPIKVGEQLPQLNMITISGDTISNNTLKDKVVFINLFSTNCQVCIDELVIIQKEINNNNSDFKMLCIGRGHTSYEIEKFIETYNLDLPFVADSTFEIYNKFAKRIIPRNIIVGKDAIVKYHTVSYSKNSIIKMKKLIDEELKK